MAVTAYRSGVATLPRRLPCIHDGHDFWWISYNDEEDSVICYRCGSTWYVSNALCVDQWDTFPAEVYELIEEHEDDLQFDTVRWTSLP